jgi:N-acyl-D-aspartate/D-glutamate deacylase
MAQRSIMFLAIPGWWGVLSKSDPAEKIAALQDPTTRAGLVGGLQLAAQMRGGGFDPAGYVIRDVVLDHNREYVGRTLGDVAAERGTSPAELMLDLSVEEGLGTWFQRAEIGHCSTEAVGALLADPLVHVGASDGGAHVGSFATYGDTGFLLSRYVRESGALTLEGAVKKITSDPCAIWGIPDRGVLRDGAAADVVVFDEATVDRGPEVLSGDFPGDGQRWIRHSVGVDAVVVNGVVTWTADGGYASDARGGVIATR